MATVNFQTDALTRLCDKNRLELLNTIDNLRLHGMQHLISMPRIIVCGGQSSGKSSILEAISGIPFPIKGGGPCTRFPIEVVLCNTSQTGVHVSIVPDESRSKAEILSLRDFSETLEGFDEIPAVVKEAGIVMQKSTSRRQENAYFKDVLRIQIAGPDQPHLIIIDLPGLPRSFSDQQVTKDAQLVHDIVKSYIAKPETIILAVISAEDSYTNQPILNMVRGVDQNDSRTLGIITKPDTLIRGSQREASYVSLVQD